MTPRGKGRQRHQQQQMASSTVGQVCDVLAEAARRAGCALRFECRDSPQVAWAHGRLAGPSGAHLGQVDVTAPPRDDRGFANAVGALADPHPPVGKCRQRYDAPFFPALFARPLTPCVRIDTRARGWRDAIGAQLERELEVAAAPPPPMYNPELEVAAAAVPPIQASQMYNPELPAPDAVDPSQLQTLLDSVQATVMPQAPPALPTPALPTQADDTLETLRLLAATLKGPDYDRPSASSLSLSPSPSSVSQ